MEFQSPHLHWFLEINFHYYKGCSFIKAGQDLKANLVVTKELSNFMLTNAQTMSLEATNYSYNPLYRYLALKSQVGNNYFLFAEIVTLQLSESWNPNDRVLPFIVND